MTDSNQDNAGGQESVHPQSQEDVAKALRLRSERPRVTRLSRKVLAGGAALALALVSGAVLWALQSNQKRSPAPEELFTTDHHNVADGLVGLPKDYAGIPRDVPRLGPPLPGDLGRPIVAAQNQSGPLAADAEQQRVNRSLRQHALTKYLPPQTRHHRRTRRSLRTGRIGSSLSSTRPSIAVPQVPIALPSRRRPSWSKQGRLFRPLSSLGSAPICRARSPRRSPKTSMTRPQVGLDSGRSTDRGLR